MNSELIAGFAQHTVMLQRVGASFGKDITPYLEEIERQVQLIFNKYEGRGVTANNRKAIQEQINKVSREQLQGYIAELKASIRAESKEELDFAVEMLNDVFDDDLPFEINQPSSADVHQLALVSPIKLGENSFVSYNTLMTNFWQRWTNEIDGVVMAGFTQGQTVNEVAKAVYDELRLTTNDTSSNTLTRARRSARLTARTGLNHYANRTRVAFVDANDKVLTGYRFISVLDSRTSQQCRALDQRFIPKDSDRLSALTPPLHPNCRSALVYEVDPKYRLDDEDSKRASAFEVDGETDRKQVSTDGIYYDKLSKLSARDQDNVLGPTLGKAFRKMKPAEFAKMTINSMGEPLTITEMRRRDNLLGRLLREN